MMEPLVSVLIVAYNHEKYIRQAIESCLMQQTSFPFEIIIHDDASTDNTSEIIQEYADRYQKLIIPILQKENQYSKGMKITATVLIPKARGKYIAFCEGDDYWIDPQKLEKQVSIMENDPIISMCFTATKWVFVNENNKTKIRRYYWRNHLLSSKDILMGSGRVIDTVSTMVKKEVYDDLPDWYYLAPAGDFALALVSIVKGRLFYLDDVTALYRRGVPNSWTTVNNCNSVSYKNSLNKLIKMIEAFDEYTEFKYHYFIKKRINLEALGCLIYFDDQDAEKDLFFSRFTLLGKLEYYFFHTLKSRRLWYRYHRVLRLLGGW